MAKWTRLLSRPAGASTRWHVLARDKEFAIADALCGETFPGPVEVTSDTDKLTREGRCPDCEARLAAKQTEAFAGIGQVSR
jgi:hypothetical protein